MPVNMHLVDAQQARRVLDRLVGYKISPLLWDKVRRGLSAGRVQTVALRLIVEREREIRAFEKREYWTIDVEPERQEAAGAQSASDRSATTRTLEIASAGCADDIVAAARRCRLHRASASPRARRSAIR